MDGQKRGRSRSEATKLLTASLLFAVGFGLGCGESGPDPKRFAHHLGRAQEAMSRGPSGLKTADVELRGAIASDSSNAQAVFLLGEVRLHQKDFPGARFYFEEALFLEPEHPEATAALGFTLRSQDPERAQQLVDRAIRLAPKNPRGHVAQAELALGAGRLEDALAAAEQSVLLDADLAATQDVLGRTHEGLYRQDFLLGKQPDSTRLQAAATAFERSANLPSLGDPWSGRIASARVLSIWPDRQEEALEAYRELFHDSHSEASVSTQIRITQAARNVAVNMGDIPFATRTLEHLIDLNPMELSYWDELAQIQENESPGKGGETIRKLLAEKPEDPEVHLRYASFLRATTGSSTAIDYLNEQAEQERLRPEMIGALIEIHEQLKQIQKRDNRLAELEAEFPFHSITLQARGNAALQAGDTANAVRALRQLVTHADSDRAQHLLAYAEFAERNYAQSLQAIARAGEINPGQEHMLRRLKAHAAYRANDCEQAISAFAALLSQDSLEPDDHVLLARCFYRIGEPAVARRILRDLLTSPNPPVEGIVEFSKQEGLNPSESDRIERTLQVALEIHPDNPQLITQLALKQIQKGQKDAANRRLDAAVARGAIDSELLFLRGQLNLEAGDLETARTDLAEAYRLRPTLPRTLALLVRTLLELDDTSAAIAALTRGQKLGLLGRGHRALLGELQLATGNREEALQNLLLAANQGHKAVKLKRYLSVLLAEQTDEFDRALALAQQFVTTQRYDPDSWDLLGYVFLRANRFQEAETSFRRVLQLNASIESPARADSLYRLGLTLEALGRDEEAAPFFERAEALDEAFSRQPGSVPPSPSQGLLRIRKPS